MTYKYMRSILFFDLPVVKKEDRKEAAKFRRDIVKLGFYMLQESVYVKMNIDPFHAERIAAKAKALAPKSGSIIIINVTENQFQNMILLSGDKKSSVIDSSDRLVEL